MKKLAAVFTFVFICFLAQSASATPVYLDVADETNGSSVELSNIDTGLSVLFGRDFGGIAEDTSIYASLASSLGNQQTTLGDGASWTIDFITFEVIGTGIGSFDIDATLAFDKPKDVSGDFTGNGAWGTINLGIRGTYSAGALLWDDPIQTLSLTDGNTLQIALEQGFVIGAGNDYTLAATITNLGGGEQQAAPVPEPATLLLFGTGMIGLASFRRTKKA